MTEVGTTDEHEPYEQIAAVGVVPTDGRGSLPFALLHGESLIAVASWALGEAGVELLDFDASWELVRDRGGALVVHDPLCPATPVEVLRETIAAGARGDEVVVAVRPVTDTVKESHGDVVGATVDRDGLVAVASPLVLPASVVAALPGWPALGDLADLVSWLRDRFPVRLVEAPALARRVVDESDLRLLEAAYHER